jgi:hypothetical protein
VLPQYGCRLRVVATLTAEPQTVSKGLGRIERHILEEIERAAEPDIIIGQPGAVFIRSRSLCREAFGAATWNYQPTEAQRKAVTRAMRSFVRKKQQYALAGGKGRRGLLLYEPADPLSAMMLKLELARKPGQPHPTTLNVRAWLDPQPRQPLPDDPKPDEAAKRRTFKRGASGRFVR